MAVNKVEKIDGDIKVNNVLLSVSDKTGLEDLVKALINYNPSVKLYSTGGTFNRIKEIPEAVDNIISVSDYTGQPEMQGGLVKTLDFKIYLGLLSETYNNFHKDDLVRTKAVTFDMVVVNLYPFRETIAREGSGLEEARSNIDIGGPCMLRASAKNFLRVASVCNPGDYKSVIDELHSKSALSLEIRFDLAKKSFKHTAEYDMAISTYLSGLALDKAGSSYQIQ